MPEAAPAGKRRSPGELPAWKVCATCGAEVDPALRRCSNYCSIECKDQASEQRAAARPNRGWAFALGALFSPAAAAGVTLHPGDREKVAEHLARLGAHA
jgi:hypothetical protein